MRSPLRYMPILAGALALAGWTGIADAQTALNVGGSSAGRNFATDVPLNLCDNASPPTASRFASADGNRITWVCKRGGSDIIIRYSATSSSDGINKILQPASNPASNMNFHDHLNTAGCTGPTLTTRADGRQYNNHTGCSNASVTSLPVHMGAADVQGSSFHQTAPANGGVVPPASITPLPTTGYNSTPIVTVPFSIFAGKGVVKLNAAGNAPAGQIDGLSRLEVEQIFARGVTDWGRIGFGTVTDALPGTLEANSPIVLCLRTAGSGTLATFDETLMLNATQTPGQVAGQVIFNPSSSGVLSCLAANRRSIGYLDADQLESFNAGGANAGLAYPVRIDGGLAYDEGLTDKKRDLKCGKYAYWANWRLNRRTAGEGAAIDALASAFITNASAQATIGVIPTGKYWASDEEMFVSKSVDKGPLSWKAGDHPQCR